MNTVNAAAKTVAATTGDFNQDGKLDAAVANLNSGTISIYPGDGAGGLGTPVNLTVGTNPVAIAKGDIDRNGKIDLIVTNAGSNDVSILLNRGGFQFDAALNIPTGLSPRMTVVGDFNYDGKADLAVANRDSNNIAVFLGNGNGTFGVATNYATGPQPVSITINDFNRDGKPDLVVGSNRVPNLTFLFGDGNGGFNTPTALGIEPQLDQPINLENVTQAEPIDYDAIDVISGDLDRDGNPDLLWSLANLGIVQVALGDGKGGFGQASSIAAGRLPGRISIGDVNGDGKFDLAVGSLGSNSVKVMLGDGAGAFPQKADYPVISSLNPSSTASLGNNLVYSPSAEPLFYEGIEAIIGNDRQVYMEWMDYEGIERASSPGDNRVMMEILMYEGIDDFNGDGRRDLLVVSSLTNTVGVMLNTCVAVQCPIASFAPQTQYPIADGATAIVSGYINLDGYLDIATANWQTHNVSIFLGKQDGTFQYLAGPSLGSGSDFFAYSMTAAYFNHDGFLDLAVASEGQNKVWIFLGKGDGTFMAAPGTPFNVTGNPYSIAAAKIDGDAFPDLVLGNRISRNLTFYKGIGNGTFSYAGVSNTLVGEVRYVLARDLNLDGKVDFAAAVVTPGTTEPDYLTVMYGNGDFTISLYISKLSLGDRPRAIASGDFNMDGKPDLAVANEGDDNVAILLGITGGFLHKVGSPYKTGDFPISMIARDFDNDGRIDLATANFNSNDVTILKGDGAGGFILSGFFPVGIQPFAMVSGDFNRDSRVDLAAANLTSDSVSVLLNNCSPNIVPNIEVSPSRLDFGSVKLGTVKTLDLLVRNTGTANLIVSNESVNPSVFSIPGGSTTFTLAPGSTRTLQVAFTPTALGSVSGTLVITSNDPIQTTFSVPLAGKGICGFVLNPTVASYPASGGSGSFVVSGSPACSYSAVSNDSWVAITSGATGTGGQSVGYSVAANTGTVTRTGTISVSGETFTVIQSGTGSGCTTPAFKPAASVGVTPGATGIVTADFNMDGKPDLAVASWNLNVVKVLLGNGSGGFSEITGPSLLSGSGFFAYTLAAGDFDGDNKPDLAVANEAANRIQVFRGDGAGGFTQFPGSPISVGNGPYSLDAADLNNDGKLDLATANRYSNDLWILIGSGDGRFALKSTLLVSPTLRDLRTTTVGDVNLDGKLDLVVAASDTNNVAVLINDGTGSYSLNLDPGKLLSVGVRPKAVAIADLDLDGKPDLVVTNEGEDTVSVFKGNGNGDFGRFPIPPVIPSGKFQTGDFPIAVVARDFNSDGLPDIATVNFNSNDVTVLLGNGGGLFSALYRFGVGTQPWYMVSADFNLDGKPDLASSNLSSADVSILINSCTAVALTADLSITKTNNVTSVAPGLATSYEIVVTNNGPNAVTGARVLDTLPAQISGATWQCVATSGSSCAAAAGSGNIDTLVNLAVGGKATFTLGATIAATASGSVANTATVSAPLGVTDPVAGNNSATDTDTITARIVRIVSASGAPGTVVSLPVEIDSQGNEQAMGFSVSFDPGLLSNPQATLGADAAGASLLPNSSQASAGRFGVAMLLSGRTFAAGRRQAVILSFTISAVASSTTTSIDFIDQPAKREIVDPTATVLPVAWLGGKITVVQGFEGDVAPRPNGNNELTVADWLQTQRFVAALDVPAAGSEFQRADTSPRSSRGDGKLDAGDVSQAGRYAVALDPPTLAGGPTSPMSLLAINFMTAPESILLQAVREVRLVSSGIERGQNGVMSVEFFAIGNENAMSFTMSFDPAQLTYVGYAEGSGASGMSILVNSQQAPLGRIGVVAAMPPGQAMSAGSKQLLTLTFAAKEQGNPAPTHIGFVNQPVRCDVADVDANSVASGWAEVDLQLLRTVIGASAANYATGEQAAESIIAAYGRSMATVALNAPGIPLPTELGGTTVKVKDSLGVERLSPLFYVSATQVNFQIPAGTAIGDATFTITSGDGTISNGTMKIVSVVPAIFSADSSGQGLAAAWALRVKPDGSLIYEPVAAYDPMTMKFRAVPIDFGPAADQMFLVLYGTGIRGRSSLSAVSALIGGTAQQVTYAGLQGDWVGLDQVNIALPRTLAGRGEVDVILTVDTRQANKVRVQFK